MKASTLALRNLLATRQFFIANLYTFTLADGTVLRYGAGDIDISANSHLYGCGGQTGPYFERDGKRPQFSWKRGLEVSSATFDVIPGSATINGISFLKACRAGLFDGAECQIERAFMATYGDTSAGTVILFVGRVAEIDPSRTVVTFTINSHVERLNINMPRNLYQAGCGNTLFDTSCGLNRASFAVTGAASSGSTTTQVNATLSQATGYFDLGTLLFTSGSNAGLSRTVKTYTNGSPSTIALISPLPFAVGAGDTFTIYPGCDKSQTTCLNKFSNLANFKGEPYVPAPETAI